MDPALLMNMPSTSSTDKPSSAKMISQDLLNRLTRTLGGGSSSKSERKQDSRVPQTPVQLPTPAISTPSSPFTMANNLTDAISTPFTSTVILTPTSPAPPSFGAELRRTNSTSSVSSSIKRKLALSGLGVTDFFKKLGKDIAAFSGKSTSSAPEASASSPSESPSRVRSTDDHQAQDPLVRSPAPYGHAKLLSMVAEGEEESDSASDDGSASHEAFPLPSSSPNHLLSPIPNNNANLYTSAPYWTNNTNGGTGEGEETPDLTDPAYLAHRIQSLIDALPAPEPLPPNSPPPSAPPTRTIPLPPDEPSDGHGKKGGRRRKGLPIAKPSTPKRDKSGKPIPPPSALPEVGEEDKEVLKILQSATIMNGGKDKEEGRTTVWDILQQLQWGGGGKERGRDGEDERSDMGSVMMYSPLIPGKKDIVELAEVAPVWVEEELQDGEEVEQVSARKEEAVIPVGGWVKTMWPLGGWFGAVQDKEKAEEASPSIASAPEIVLLPPPLASPRLRLDELPRSPYIGSPRMLTVLPPVESDGIVEDGGRRYRVRETKAWVPSADKVSYEVMWWGYRVYLPPPAMLVLSDKTIEAQKRAALLTSALTWFFNNIPLDILPLPLQPTVLLLRRLAPYLGYIGTFIAWSWSTVKSYDLGNGVILSATWLLPIALVPGTWFENQFPKSPTMSPTPLPPHEDLPSSPSEPTTPLPSVPATPAPESPKPVPSTPGSEPTSPAPPYEYPLPDTPSVPPTPTLPSSPGEAPVSSPPTSPTPNIPLPPEDEEGHGEGSVPWSPDGDVGISPRIGRGVGIHASSSSSGEGGRARGAMTDKRGWGRFQVLRGAPRGLGQSFVVKAASSTPGSPLSPASSEATLEEWGTPMSTPVARQAAVLPGSPLMDELLRSKRVGTVPLPGGGA
ncbi:hypothetical protein DFP72DRAFT_1045615 [Ephemerocybe angulata]|uniref:Uncharacterized protein n=1 Tax=Ephemerocybe angulata TaxID=980116 RepID=A0A8H6HZD9_9AGAR|nr:hypothetical protein DFP72DRAFT_1045615 [Tulosesus angulatus]